MSADIAAVPESIPVEELTDVISTDLQIKVLLQRIGEIEVTAEEQKDQVKAQLKDALRKQGMENARIMRRYNIPQGSKIDFADGKVTTP
jgi:hypothetical protein